MQWYLDQGVVVTEPNQAMQVLRSRKCDKLPFQYKMLDPVSCFMMLLNSE